MKIKFQNEIKKELIEYYDSLKFAIDIKVQEKLKHEKPLDEQDQSNRLLLLEENVYLVEQIDRVLDSNLNDVNNFFDQCKEDELVELNTKFENANDEIKRRALKSYIVCIKYKNHELFGLHFEFEWYIDQNQLNFIKFENNLINFSIFL
jgi:hypothetical protein